MSERPIFYKWDRDFCFYEAVYGFENTAVPGTYFQPLNATTVKPEHSRDDGYLAYWDYNTKKWYYVQVPTTCAEFVNNIGAVSHTSRSESAEFLRQLIQRLHDSATDKDDYKLVRGSDDLCWYLQPKVAEEAQIDELDSQIAEIERHTRELKDELYDAIIMGDTTKVDTLRQELKTYTGRE